MKALITGASSGLGKDMAMILSKKGYDIIAVARNKANMEKAFSNIKNCIIIPMDLSIPKNCFKLYNMVKDEDIEIVINNAGFGEFGFFNKTNLKREIDMINLNIKAVHILTKLFLKDMIKKDRGYILNVGSIGSFYPSPFYSSYFASKSYVLNLDLAIYEELKKLKSNVYIGTFCPGTINTNFHKNANVKGKVFGSNSYKASIYAIEKMFAKKPIIINGFAKFVPCIVSILPKVVMLKLAYFSQALKR